MMSKIAFGKILREHFRTLHRNNCKSISIWDLLLFYMLPLAFAGLVVFWWDRRLDDKAVDFLATVFSIFVGLLLNLLVLIFDNVKKSQTSDKHFKVLRETFANISYSILVSILLVSFLMLTKLLPASTLCVVSFVVAAMVGNFFLTLLMILKRVHTLLLDETT